MEQLAFPAFFPELFVVLECAVFCFLVCIRNHSSGFQQLEKINKTDFTTANK